jgi:APA family basic amino acid/polyamine antiporter
VSKAVKKPVAPPVEVEAVRLPAVLGPWSALCVVVGSVIGSGIFITPARVANHLPAMGPIAIAWILGGLFSLAGALTLGELAAMLPHAGGLYVYLRKAYGDLPAFLYGWTEFLIIRAGSMATLATAFALYCGRLWSPTGWPLVAQTAVAVGAMAIVAAVNVAGTIWGGRLQVVGTVLKVGALGAIIVLPFALGKADASRLTPVWPEQFDFSLIRGALLAMIAVLWTYDGWVNSAALAEEVRDPERNMPRTIIGGVFILIAVYLGATLAYHLVLPMDEIAAAALRKGEPKPVAGDVLRRLLGDPGQVAISLVVMTSTFISLNGNVLAGPRAYFALARDGLFPRWLCAVHPRFQTPATAILTQTGLAIALTIAGTALILVEPPASSSSLPTWVSAAWVKLSQTPLYDVLFTYVIFGATIFYMLSIASVFVLRARRPDLPRPYRTWGYPATPLFFVVGALLLLGGMLAETPFESLAGLGIIALGLPAYRWLRISR